PRVRLRRIASDAERRWPSPAFRGASESDEEKPMRSTTLFGIASIFILIAIVAACTNGPAKAAPDGETPPPSNTAPVVSTTKEPFVKPSENELKTKLT